MFFITLLSMIVLAWISINLWDAQFETEWLTFCLFTQKCITFILLILLYKRLRASEVEQPNKTMQRTMWLIFVLNMLYTFCGWETVTDLRESGFDWNDVKSPHKHNETGSHKITVLSFTLSVCSCYCSAFQMINYQMN